MARGFPENESMAYAVISWGSAMAALAGATKVIVKTPHEASGIPTRNCGAESSVHHVTGFGWEGGQNVDP